MIWFYSGHGIQELTNCLFHFLCVLSWLKKILILLARMGAQIFIQLTLWQWHVPFWWPWQHGLISVCTQKPIMEWFKYFLVYASTFQYIAEWTSIYCNVMECFGMNLYVLVHTSMYLIKDTESFLDLQQSYRAYNFVSELEFRTVPVLSRPYKQGMYGRCAGMARRPLTVWQVPCSNNSVPMWTALFSHVGPLPGPARPNDRIAWHAVTGVSKSFNFVFDWF
jgi:hypothetical protein